jgi:hypothetical protein
MTRWRINPAAVLASGWALVFCFAHVYWAFGVIDLLVIPACLIGAGFAWRLASVDYRRWLFVLGSAGAALMLWHAGLNYLFLGVRSALGQPLTTNDRYYALLYEPFWLLGGVLWLLAVLRFRRSALPARELVGTDRAPALAA